MDDRQLELIAGLAEGTLSPEEASRAEELVASDDELRAEFEAQRRALEVLQTAPRPELSMAESAALQRSIRERLGLTAEVAPVRRSYRWLGLAAAAAAVALVAIVGPLIGLLSTGDSDEADLAVTTVARSEALDSDGAERELAAATTTVPPATQAPAAEAPAEAGALPPLAPALDLGEISQDDLQNLASGFVISDEPATLRSLTQEEAEAFEDAGGIQFFAQEGGDEAACLEQVLAGYSDAAPIVPAATAVFEGAKVIVYVIATDEGHLLVAVDVATCEVVATAT